MVYIRVTDGQTDRQFAVSIALLASRASRSNKNRRVLKFNSISVILEDYLRY